tara:strand:- start:136 stop:720 length:585 start_codon:yes stop_codon:yes gene_type:complete
MEPKFQNSFIPKRPITSSRGSGVPRRKQQVSFFSVIVSLAFILVLAAAGGLFGYTKYISSEISKKDALLQEAIGAVDKEEVKELSVVDTQLRSATTLLRHHLVPTYFFDFLEENTLQTIQFTELGYLATPGDDVVIHMAGSSNSYSSIALQSDIFSHDEHIESSLFSNFGISDTGRVTFEVDLVINNELISYTE